VSANFSFETATGHREYRSPIIPFSAVITNSTVQIPAEIMRALATSTIEVPRIGQNQAESFFAAAHSIPESGFASTATDPEADLKAFAAANPVPSQSDDLYLTDSAWASLTGASYAEDIGNGTIAQVVIDPISSTNPNGWIHLYLVSRQIVIVNPQYQPNNPRQV